MGWAKRDDAVAAVRSGYSKALERVQHLAEAERGMGKTPVAVDEYLTYCRLMGRQADHALIEACLERFLLKYQRLSWQTH